MPLVATGSLFTPVKLEIKIYPIAQCNNVCIFLGIGLSILLSGAPLPDVNDIQAVSRAIAMAVAKAA